MSTMKEIEKKEAQLQSQILKLDLLHEKIKRELGSEERSNFEKEINILKDSLFETEKELKNLHQRNRKSFFLALAIFIVICLIFIYFRL